MPEERKRVMICDDQRIAVQPLADRLTAKGVDVSITTRPEDCLAAVSRNQFDLFVLDMELGPKAPPNLRDGLALAKALWEQGLVPINVPIVGITGFSDEWKKQALDLGLVNFFKKPFDTAEITPVLLNLLDIGAEVSLANEDWLSKVRGDHWHILDLTLSRDGSVDLRSNLVAGKGRLKLRGRDYQLALYLLESCHVDEILFEELGCKLHHSLFQTEVNIGFHQHRLLSQIAERPTRLLLHLSGSGWEDLPWEFCRYTGGSDSGHWLGGDPWVTCARVAPNSGRLLADETLPKRLRILVVCAKPSMLPALDIEEEIRALREAFTPLAERVDWRLLGPNELNSTDEATPDTATQHITEFKPHIVHFISHGNANAIALGDRELEAWSDYFLNYGLKGSGVKLLVLNSCLSGRWAPNSPGVAIGGLTAGVQAVIGHFFTISDSAAIRFTQLLYRGLVRGEVLDTAFQEARRLVWSQELPKKRSFLPVLFVRDRFLRLETAHPSS